MSLELVVSIINYRTGDLTIACVQSVLADLGDINAEIVIIDNCSGDGSSEQIQDWLKTVPDAPIRFVQSATNSGFSGGHNQGFAAAEAAYYLVLNSDAIVRPGFFENLMRTARAHPRAGFIAPKIATEEGDQQKSRFRFHSPQSEFIRGAATAQITALLKHKVVALELDDPVAKVEWASFACILLSGDMVRALGPMDEGYFLYFEDCEYCLRGRRAGWGLALADDAVAVHFRGGSGPVKSLEAKRKRLPGYYYESRTRFLRQAYGPFGPFLGNAGWCLGRALGQLRRLIGKPVSPAIEHEGRDIWKNFLSPMKGSAHNVP